MGFLRDPITGRPAVWDGTIGIITTTESLILAQNERWRRGLGMQVERETDSSETGVEWRTGE